MEQDLDKGHVDPDLTKTDRTGGSWHIVESQRAKKQRKKNEKGKEAQSPKQPGSQSQENFARGERGDHTYGAANNQGNRFHQPKRKPLPPLPKDDVKIIMRPTKGLTIKDILIPTLASAILKASQPIQDHLNQAEDGPVKRERITGADFILRTRPGSNIIILSVNSTEVANVLRRIGQLELNGNVHQFNTYVADPDNCYRGVVHGIPPDTPMEHLVDNMRVRTHGVQIERARMLGKSTTALITFTGGSLPKCIYYMGGEMRLHPYKPTVQICTECFQAGHRPDVCPHPVNICKKCGLKDPPTHGHECVIKCAVCGAADHETGSNHCPRKLKNIRSKNANRQSRSLERVGQKKSRGFSSGDEEDRHRLKSTSPQGQRSRTPSKEPTKDAQAPKPPQQQQAQKPQVSWATVVHHNAPQHTPNMRQDPGYEILKQENTQLRAQLRDEERKRQRSDEKIKELEERLTRKILQLESDRKQPAEKPTQTTSNTDTLPHSATKPPTPTQQTPNTEVPLAMAQIQLLMAETTKSLMHEMITLVNQKLQDFQSQMMVEFQKYKEEVTEQLKTTAKTTATKKRAIAVAFGAGSATTKTTQRIVDTDSSATEMSDA